MGDRLSPEAVGAPAASWFATEAIASWPVAAKPLPPPSALEALAMEVGAVAFGLLTLLALRTLIQSGRPGRAGVSPVATGMQMRRRLIVALVVANGLRCLSLVVAFVTKDGNETPSELFGIDAEQQKFALNIFELLPSFVFLSAFSLVVLFWAQLHYTTTMVPLSLLDCVFVCLNIASYLLFIAIALCTFLLKVYRHIRTYLMSVIGLLSVVVAVAFCYYGFVVVSELSETSRKKMPGKRLATRVTLFSVICPLLLFLRGSCYMVWGTSLWQPSRLVDLGLCLASEWMPSAAALLILTPLQRGGMKSANETLDDSTDSEAPLLDENEPAPQRSLAGAPGSSWKQLYPQPAATPDPMSP